MNLQQILQNAEITELQDGDILYVVRPGAASADRAIKPESIGLLNLAATHKQQVSAETFDSITDMTFSDAGNLATANIVWLDGKSGTISHLEEDSEGRLTSLRYNRPDNKYITYGVTYDADGIPTPTLTATGY